MSIPATPTSGIPTTLHQFVDDAAVFPPGNAALADAVRDHHEHRQDWFAGLVGAFVVSDVKLPDLIDVLDESDADDAGALAVTVVASGGAGAVEPAFRWVTGCALLELAGIEVALRSEEDLPGNVRRVAAAAEACGVEAPVYVEPPRGGEPGGGPSHGWLAALDEIAAAGLRLKLRTGGVEAHMFPTSGELAGYIDAALDRELRFKCTAGLHNALRHRDPSTGFEHHGFLNITAATAAAFAGAGRDSVVATLEDQVLRTDLATVEHGRRWFTSFGSCSVLEPLEDLIDMGLVALPE